MVATALRKLVNAGRKREFLWRYVFNFAPTVSYSLNRLPIQGEVQRVRDELRTNGIAISSLEKLFGGESGCSQLGEAVDTLEQSMASQLSEARASANDEENIGKKTFNVELLGERPEFDVSSVYAQFALQKPLLQVANAYFGMLTSLRYYNIWHTFATRTQPRESQLWHRDREDFKILKVFVYLSDVDEGAGPLTYAKGSQLSRGMKRSPEYFVEGGVKRSTDPQMAAVVPPSKWLTATGAKGTIVFADTSGYHKGGLARERDRLMYVCMFTSHASQSKDLLRRCGAPVTSTDKALAYALSIPNGRK